MALVSEIESVPRAGVVQLWCAINEEHSVVQIVFLVEFSKEPTSNGLRSRWFELCVEQFVYIWIDGGVQPLLFVIKLGHSFTDRNVIRTVPIFWL